MRFNQISLNFDYIAFEIIEGLTNIMLNRRKRLHIYDQRFANPITPQIKRHVYGSVSGYITQYERYHNDYRFGHRLQTVNEHLKPIVTKYGDLPQKEARCSAFERAIIQLYNDVFDLSKESTSKKNKRNQYPSVLPSKTIENLYKNQFYDPGVMEFIKCSLMAMFTNQSLDLISQFWIHNIKRIGEPSADGEVSLAKIGGYSELVVFKVSKNPKNVYSTMYEGLVGHQVNKLRRMGNVNFAYTYGVIKCGHKNFCKPEDTVLMQEFVKGTSYESYVRRINSPSDFMSAILQLTFSLKWAYETYRFQHLDLHNQNVMARELDRASFYIPYQYNGSNVYVKSNRVMTIIDFGRSAIRVKNDLIYSADTPDSNPNGLSPLADIFKLLGFTLYRAEQPLTEVKKVQDRFNGMVNEREQIVDKEKATDYTIIETAHQLMEFFLDLRELNSRKIVEEFRDTYYVLYGIRNDLTFDQFLEYIRSHPTLGRYWNELIHTSPPRDQVLRCDNDCIVPTSLIPNPTTEAVDTALDFLIRVNEGWAVQVSDWDELIRELEQALQDPDRTVVGLRDLVRGSLHAIPNQYHSRIQKYLV